MNKNPDGTEPHCIVPLPRSVSGTPCDCMDILAESDCLASEEVLIGLLERSGHHQVPAVGETELQR